MDYLFFAKSKKPFFGGVFGDYPQNEIFSQTFDSVSFLPLRRPNFVRSFREILWSILKNKRVYVLTYWHTDSDEILGPLFA